MNWQEYSNVFTSGWQSDDFVTNTGKGYWRISRLNDGTDANFYLHFMETDQKLLGFEVTKSTFHNTFNSMQSARQHAEKQAQA
jgi:hypothetical protein